jgi:hypothetical protein
MISDKILNQLRSARTADGRVGMRVYSDRDSQTVAWISIVIPNRTETTDEVFEIEYIELTSDWLTDPDGWDWDYYLASSEIYRVTNLAELESKLSSWTEDLSGLEPIANVDHPKF